MTLEFTDKVPHADGSYRDWVAVAAACKQHPGQWALVAQNAKSSIANAIRQGSIRVLSPHLGFRVSTANNNRAVSPPTCDVYVQYSAENDTTLKVKERESEMRKERKR